jgi:serine/threonine protein kinase
MPEYPAGSELVDSIPQVEVAELFQKGGQKAVYKATIEGQIVALKVIPFTPEEVIPEEGDPDIVEDPPAEDDVDMDPAVERVKREVAILEQADVPVLSKRGPLGLGTFQAGDARWMYFTEEWIEGRTLRTMIGKGRLTPEQVARLGIDLIQATCWLSSRGLVHRDIKPENVMWAEDRSRFVLLDAGIALDLHGPSLTQLPVAIGTMAYFSPEQLDGSKKRELDFRSDLFAIGTVLYESAVGEHPFVKIGTTAAQLYAGLLTESPRPVAEVIPDYPADLSTFIGRLLNKAPHLRFRTCDRAKMAIEEIGIQLKVEA